MFSNLNPKEMQIRQRLFHAVADLSALTRFLSHINTPDLNSIRGTRIGMNLDWQEFQKAQTPQIIQIWGVWKGERKKEMNKSIYMDRTSLCIAIFRKPYC